MGEAIISADVFGNRFNSSETVKRGFLWISLRIDECFNPVIVLSAYDRIIGETCFRAAGGRIIGERNGFEGRRKRDEGRRNKLIGIIVKVRNELFLNKTALIKCD